MIEVNLRVFSAVPVILLFNFLIPLLSWWVNCKTSDESREWWRKQGIESDDLNCTGQVRLVIFNAKLGLTGVFLIFLLSFWIKEPSSLNVLLLVFVSISPTIAAELFRRALRKNPDYAIECAEAR